MANIVHRIGIKASSANVYEALTSIKGLSNWWTKETTGQAEPNGLIEFSFKTPEGELKGKMIMKVINQSPSKKVQWKCVDGPSEWIGTDINFDLSEQDGMTIVLFGHRNWKEEIEFTSHCSMKWAVFLLSLRAYVETGIGSPSPSDLKIDNWN